MLQSASPHATSADLDSNQHSALVSIYKYLIRLTEQPEGSATLPILAIDQSTHNLEVNSTLTVVINEDGLS